MSGGDVIGWKLDRAQRDELLRRFPPRYPDVIADHVTLRAKAERNAPLPPPVEARIVGRADDGNSIEAMVVTIDGTTDRPDGSTFHISWSLDRSNGRDPRHSTDLIREKGWERFAEPIRVALAPARF